VIVMRHRLRWSIPVAFVALLSVTCQRAGDTDVVAPGLDNHPPAQTSDGRVIGADEKSPQHLLAEQGTSAHPAPGWKIDRNGISYDPKRQPGEAKGATTITQLDGGTETVSPSPAAATKPLPEE
jgi:hypothetical protein